MDTTILGISPGTRTMGLAIVRNGVLVDWRTQTFPGKWSLQKQEHITAALRKVIEEHQVEIVAMKMIHPSLRSAAFLSLTREIKNLLGQLQVSLDCYTIDNLKEYCEYNEKGNKQILIEYIKHRYPELFHECTKEEKNENVYYIKMLEAVIAATFAEKLNSQKLP